MNATFIRPLFAAVAAVAATTFSAGAWAVAYSDFGAIANLESGWAADTMSVRHSAPFTNPANCSVVNAGYATSPGDAGHSLFHTMLLAAFLNRKEASLIVDGCVYGKPRVVGVVVK